MGGRVAIRILIQDISDKRGEARGRRGERNRVGANYEGNGGRGN